MIAPDLLSCYPDSGSRLPPRARDPGGRSLYSLTQENRLELQYFEDLQLGGLWISRRRTVTESDLIGFSGLSGDFNPLHVDQPHAQAGHFGGRVAHASLVSGIALGLGSMDVPLCATVAMVGMSWKFQGPVRPGDTIHTRWRLARKRAVGNPRWGLAVWEVEVIDQEARTAALGEVARLVARRSGEGAEEVPSEPATGKSHRRRRRSSGGAGSAAAGVATAAAAAAAVPESAPADVPPASRRRRSRRGSGGGAASTPPGPAPSPTPAEMGEPAAHTEAATGVRRRRRRRSPSGRTDGPPEGPTGQAGDVRASGQESGQESGPPSGATLAVSREMPADPPPAPALDVPKGEPEAPALGKVLRRLRRPRSPRPPAGD